MRNYYEILGLSRDCSQDEIKKNYYRLCLKYHPDKTNGEQESTEHFKDITEAYHILRDDTSRKIYDLQLLFNKIDINEEEYALLLTYYNRVINSNEYKLLYLLYKSIPPIVKESIWSKVLKKKGQIILANKSIDILELNEDTTINLLISKIDYQENKLKVFYIFSKSGIYYFYLRRPPKFILLKNGDNYFNINFYIVN